MKVTVIGLGPGGGADLTGRARAALEECGLIVGYTAYIDLVKDDFPEKEVLSTGMRREVDRCRAAVEAALTGKDVAVVCSGDSGVYGMAGLIYEVAQEYDPIEIEVVPGITAACGGAAVLGAPLTHDSAVISLSDLLTPWEKIEKRLSAAAQADSSSASTTPPAKTGPTISSGPATSCCGRRTRLPCAALSATSAGRGRKDSSLPWASCGTPRWTCSPPCLWATARPRCWAARWSPPGAISSGGSKMEVLLFGGTGEGRELAQWLMTQQIPALVCVATEYGETLLPAGIEAHVGRLDEAGMAALMASRPFTHVVDATHPYAVEVTANIQAAAAAVGLPCLRLVRHSDGEDLCHKAGDMAAAAYMLERLPGNVLLTTGSKELDVFAKPGLVERCYPRVLPMMNSLSRCLELGFPPKNIICMQGPFSKELNVALLKQYDIKTLVTKDTGGYGGFREKAEAAREAGASLLVVERPRNETGDTLEEIQARLREGRA